ncbi:MAG: hypothetical protein ABH843_03125 [Candidatus Omnitrophota bacterium]
MVEMIERFGDQETPSVTDWVFTILKRWKIALLVFTISISLSTYYAYSELKKQTPTYKSSTIIMLGPETFIIEGTGRKNIQRRDSIEDEVTLLGSDIIAKQAAIILKEEFGYEGPIDKLASEVKEAVKVELVKDKRNIARLTSSSSDRQRAYDIVSATIEGYLKQKKDDETNFFKDAYETFTDQLNAAHDNLLKAENSLGKFIADNKEIIELMQNYEISEKATQNFIAAALNEEYLKTKAKLSEAQEFLDAVKEKVSIDRLWALSMIEKRNKDLVDANWKKILIAKEEELNALRLVNEDAHPEVIRVRGELGSIAKNIDMEIEEALRVIESALNKLKKQEKELSEFIASGLHEKIIAYNMFKRDIVVKRDIYDKLAEDLQKINIDEKIQRYTEMRIIEDHKVASTFTKTFPTNRILYGIILSILCSIASVYAIETFDTSIKSIEQLERLIDLPVLATIPEYRKHKPRSEKKKGKNKK